MTVHVTKHAIDRYCERMAPVPRDEARAVMLGCTRAIEFAAAFGAHTLRIGNGAKLVLRCGRTSVGLDGAVSTDRRVRVVTVLPRGWINRADAPRASKIDCRLALCGTAANDGRASAPVLCGRCGLRRGHPVARACTRTDCPLPHTGRCARDGGWR